ncbi:MAG: CYTH domain-containing protein [Lachnospiraceae bacterium]|nr:CYTH domain-containing protein [Lachnospiraceae bacterium]
MENIEIEKKWLVERFPDDLSRFDCLEIEQGYLSTSPTVRIRKENDDYYLTYKSSKDMPEGSVLSHEEYNLPLTRDSYAHLLSKCDGRLISKKRYLIPLRNDLTAELDIFEGVFSPLMIVEVEFETEEAALSFEAPDWFGPDVTGDPKYRNAVMAYS